MFALLPTMGGSGPMEIRRLSDRTFAAFGKVLTLDGMIPGVKPEKEFDRYETAGGIRLGPVCSTGFLVCRPREMKVAKLERHLRTSEVFVALSGDTVLVAAPAYDPLSDNAGLRAFRLPEGKAVVLKPGTWHWVPFPVGKRSARLLVLFRDGTGVDDLDVRALSGEACVET